MDMNTLRGLSTLFALLAFIAICWWAYSSKRKQRFDTDAHIPFDDEAQHRLTQQLTAQHEEKP
jgi:cytochrome c oxidase cbb3-type subunit 4